MALVSCEESSFAGAGVDPSRLANEKRAICDLTGEKGESVRSPRQLALADDEQEFASSDPWKRPRELVSELELAWRDSWMIDDTKVLQLRNPNPQVVEFDLRCTARHGASKTLRVSVPAGGLQEVGFLEGWAFEHGERIEAMLDGEVVWYHNLR